MIQATLNNRIFNLQIFSTVRFDNMQTMTVFVYGIWTREQRGSAVTLK